MCAATRQFLRRPLFLQRDAQPLAQLAFVARPGHAQDFYLAGSGLAQPFENFNGRRLARAVRSEQAETLTRLDRKVETAHRLDLAVVGFLQIAAPDGGSHTVHDTRDVPARG